MTFQLLEKNKILLNTVKRQKSVLLKVILDILWINTKMEKKNIGPTEIIVTDSALSFNCYRKVSIAIFYNVIEYTTL